jgi:hypothetical protein
LHVDLDMYIQIGVRGTSQGEYCQGSSPMDAFPDNKQNQMKKGRGPRPVAGGGAPA